MQLALVSNNRAITVFCSLSEKPENACFFSSPLPFTSTPESEQLALDFACLLAERWPFVLDDL